MSTTNKRTPVNENFSESRLKTKLHENFDRFLKEEAEEEAPIDDVPPVDDTLDLDSDLEDEIPADATDEFDPIAELGDSEKEQVESWVDEILSDSLDQVETADGLLDTEVNADDLDPMGDDVQLHDDLPMTSSTLSGIIDDDDSIAALEQALAALAAEGTEEITISDTSAPTGEEDLDLEESEEMGGSNEFDLLEAEDPMKGIDDYFDQGFEGKDVKDELSTDKKTVGSANKFKGIDTDPTMSKTKETPGGGAENNVDVIKEAKKRAVMLVHAANVIAKQEGLIEAAKKQISKLKLENLKLTKSNGILSESADIFSADARVKIAEGFDKCGSTEQVNKFYEGLVTKIKDSKKTTLNEAASMKGKQNKVIRESKKEEQKEVVSAGQQRINFLMGMSTEDDQYLA